MRPSAPFVLPLNLHEIDQTVYAQFNRDESLQQDPVVKRSLVSQSFQSSLVDGNICEFGSRCACSECMQDDRKPIYKFSRVDLTVH